MARKKKQPEHSFWEDAYDQMEAVGVAYDVMVKTLTDNKQDLLVSHLLTIFQGAVQALALQVPVEVRDRISARIAAKQQAELQAYIEKMLAEMPEDTDLAHEVEEEDDEGIPGGVAA